MDFEAGGCGVDDDTARNQVHAGRVFLGFQPGEQAVGLLRVCPGAVSSVGSVDSVLIHEVEDVILAMGKDQPGCRVLGAVVDAYRVAVRHHGEALPGHHVGRGIPHVIDSTLGAHPFALDETAIPKAGELTFHALDVFRLQAWVVVHGEMVEGPVNQRLLAAFPDLRLSVAWARNPINEAGFKPVARAVRVGCGDQLRTGHAEAAS